LNDIYISLIYNEVIEKKDPFNTCFLLARKMDVYLVSSSSPRPRLFFVSFVYTYLVSMPFVLPNLKVIEQFFKK